MERRSGTPLELESRRSRRFGWLLLGLAGAIALAQVLLEVTAPFAYGYRDFGSGRWSATWVYYHVHHGLDYTLGIPVQTVAPDPVTGEPIPAYNWHHPPLYALYLSLWAWLFGSSAMVLRFAHLPLFLLGVPAVFSIVRRLAGSVAGGMAALLMVSSPYVILFGPMVLHDGAMLGVGLCCAAAFCRWLDQPSWRQWWVVAALLFVTVSIDIPAYLWGPALFCLALAHPRRRDGVLAVLGLFPVTLVAFALLALHYGVVLDGPLGFIASMLRLADSDGHLASGASEFAGDLPLIVFRLGAGGLALMAGVGVIIAAISGEPRLRRLAAVGLALLVPGTLSVVLFFGHALTHAFWYLLLVGALAPLAVIVPLAGAQAWCRATASGRVFGAAAMTLTGVVVLGGVWHSRVLLAAESSTPANADTLDQLRPLLRPGHALISNLFDETAYEKLLREHLQSAKPPPGSTLVGRDGGTLTCAIVDSAWLLGGIESVEAFEQVRPLVLSTGVATAVTFALAPTPSTDRLADHLGRLAAPEPLGELQIYRFDLAETGGR